jgi:hypothetical protein
MTTASAPVQLHVPARKACVPAAGAQCGASYPPHPRARPRRILFGSNVGCCPPPLPAHAPSFVVRGQRGRTGLRSCVHNACAPAVLFSLSGCAPQAPALLQGQWQIDMQEHSPCLFIAMCRRILSLCANAHPPPQFLSALAHPGAVWCGRIDACAPPCVRAQQQPAFCGRKVPSASSHMVCADNAVRPGGRGGGGGGGAAANCCCC